MYADEFASQYGVAKNNFKSTSVSETKIDNSKPYTGNSGNLADFLILWAPIGMLLGCSVIFFAVLKRWTFIKEEISFNIKRLDEVPCKKCRYFSGNHYLKCAVNPSDAMTERATNCADYSPQDEKCLH